MALSRLAAAILLTASAHNMTNVASLSTASPLANHPSTIGTPGKPWGIDEFKLWRDTRVKQRCYTADILPKIESLRENTLFDVVQYGEVEHYGNEECDAFPLFAIKSRDWSEDKPNVLITGAIHGYETSGVEGAFLFLSSGRAAHYSQHFNILVAPCVSPWAYERIQRWNAKGVDPNRSFNPNGDVVEGRSFNPEAATEESAALIKFLSGDMGHVKDWTCHLDLHETTDSDETEFRPAKNARDGILDDNAGEIPDGFYLVQDETSLKPEWFTEMIDTVRKVTHIAPTDAEGKLIGEIVHQEGVIRIPAKKSLGLCAGVTNAPFRTTTEVYPDSPKATPEQCNQAQVACINGALDHILSVL